MLKNWDGTALTGFMWFKVGGNFGLMWTWL